MTLQTFLSWYPQVKLDALHSIREGAGEFLEKTYAEVNWVAAMMSDWFVHTEYTPYLDSDGNPLPPVSIVGLAEDDFNSNSRPQGASTAQPTRSSSSILYRNSDGSISASS